MRISTGRFYWIIVYEIRTMLRNCNRIWFWAGHEKLCDYTNGQNMLKFPAWNFNRASKVCRLFLADRTANSGLFTKLEQINSQYRKYQEKKVRFWILQSLVPILVIFVLNKLWNFSWVSPTVSELQTCLEDMVKGCRTRGRPRRRFMVGYFISGPPERGRIRPNSLQKTLLWC